MPRVLRLLLLWFSVFLLLLALAAGALYLFVDPNDYKDRIADLAARRTGLRLTIEGDLGLTLFPVTGLVTDRIVLFGPAGLEGPPPVRASRLRVEVDPIPLLQGNLSVRRFEVDGLEVRLVRSEDGTVNWGFPQQETGKDGESALSRNPFLSSGLSIAGVELRNGTLIWDDRSSGRLVKLLGLDLSLEGLTPGEPSELALTFSAESASPSLRATVELAGRATLLADGSGCRLEDLQGKVNAAGPALPVERVDLELAARMEANWKERTCRLDDLQCLLNGTEARGWVFLKDPSLPALSFDLALGPVDVDAIGNSLKEAPSAAKGPSADSVKTAEIPPFLRSLDAEGRVRVERIRVEGLDMHDVDLTLDAGNGLLVANPFRATLAGGTLNGSARLDLRREPPAPSLVLEGDDVQVGPVVRALSGKEEMTGRADIEVDLQSSGLAVEQWLEDVSGSAAFAVTDGTVSFFGVPEDAVTQGTNEENPFAETGQPVPFERIDGTVSARQGLLTNRDLRFQSPLLQALGDGVVDLRKKRLDYDLAVVLPLLPDVQVRLAGPIADPDVQVLPLKMLKESVEGLGKEALDLPGNIGRGAKDVGEGVKKLPGSIGDTIKGLFD